MASRTPHRDRHPDHDALAIAVRNHYGWLGADHYLSASPRRPRPVLKDPTSPESALGDIDPVSGDAAPAAGERWMVTIGK
jgi:hypothetical protein